MTVNALHHLFNAGRISKAALNRVDKEAMRLFAERQENILPYTVGKGMMRPGTLHLGETAGGRARLLPFVRSPSQRALLELTNGALRVWISDALVTRQAVSATVSDDGFQTGVGWTVTTSGGATASFNAFGMLMECLGRGGQVTVRQSVAVGASAGVKHALRVRTSHGRVLFSVGSTAGATDLVAETILDPGEHSLSFTPAGANFHIQFRHKGQDQILVTNCQVEAAGPMEVAAPWSSDNLRKIRYTQQLDVVFCTLFDENQVKIERRGDESWSVARYEPDDGPFTLARTSDVTLTPSICEGSGTLTASADFFVSGHERALFQLTHENTDQPVSIAALNEVTEPIRVVGIFTASYSDRNFSVIVSGTWVGTLCIERSFDDPDFGYEQFGSDITANGTTAVDDEEDNAIIYYRVRFKAYTSGRAIVRTVYDQHGATGICRITNVIDAQTANITVLKPFSQRTATKDWLEGAWSARLGYPTSITLFDARMFLSRDDRFWGSVPDSYYSFTLDLEGDSKSIQRDVATGEEFGQVNFLLSLQRLIFGTSGAEISARSSSFDAPITPTDVTLKPASSFGSDEESTPVKLHSRGYFIDMTRKKLVELAYNFDAQDYVGTDMTRLNDDVWRSDVVIGDNGFVEMALQRAPEPYLWVLRDDGIAFIVLCNAQEEARCLVEFSTGVRGSDRVTAVCSLRFGDDAEDDVYLQVERQTGNPATTKYYIEKMGTHSSVYTRFYDDDGNIKLRNGRTIADSRIVATLERVNGQTVGGLGHLVGRDVIVIGQIDGGPFGPSRNLYTVNSSGEIYVTELFYGTCHIGLPYYGKYKSAKLAYGAKKGTALLQPKQVEQLGLALVESNLAGIRVGRNFVEADMDVLPPRLKDLTIFEETGVFDEETDEEVPPFPFPGTWDSDSRVCILIKPGYAVSLSALVIGIDTRDK